MGRKYNDGIGLTLMETLVGCEKGLQGASGALEAEQSRPDTVQNNHMLHSNILLTPTV
jgi:hypothetical protein